MDNICLCIVTIIMLQNVQNYIATLSVFVSVLRKLVEIQRSTLGDRYLYACKISQALQPIYWLCIFRLLFFSTDFISSYLVYDRLTWRVLNIDNIISIALLLLRAFFFGVFYFFMDIAVCLKTPLISFIHRVFLCYFSSFELWNRIETEKRAPHQRHLIEQKKGTEQEKNKLIEKDWMRGNEKRCWCWLKLFSVCMFSAGCTPRVEIMIKSEKKMSKALNKNRFEVTKRPIQPLVMCFSCTLYTNITSNAFFPFSYIK